jgi:signal transduction histidine kinase/CheY-like chemotaxis protein
MKKRIFYLLLVAATIVGINVYFNISIYKDKFGYQRDNMFRNAEKAASDIENEIASFRNAVNSVLFSRIIDNLDLKSEDRTQEELKMLEILFNRYKGLVKNISIYDLAGNVLNLSSGKTDILLIDPYTTQKPQSLDGTESFSPSDQYYVYTLPVFKNNELYANIVFELSLKDYFKDALAGQINDETFRHWIVSSAGEMCYSRPMAELVEAGGSRDYTYTGMENIIKYIEDDASGFLKHEVIYDSACLKVLSAVFPMDIFSEKFGMVYSVQNAAINASAAFKTIASALLSLLLIAISGFYLFKKFITYEELIDEFKSKVSGYGLIFDALPIGIMALDGNNTPKLINQTAKNILMISPDEGISGKSLEGRFMLSRDYYNNSLSSTAYDSEQYVVYRNQGEEVSVYKKEIPIVFNNEELNLSAFIDISHIEKSRKYEAAANTAKSEFLARMSHEIRTPMNGIIGMTEAMTKEKLTPPQKEFINIIKKSADLLLSLIDDILDFSKIEAGKMQIEEIPFKLREEVKISIELFRPVIENKNLKLRLQINPDVPDNIISDPYRLRQVLSNLISNSVKFTHEGEIEVGVELVEMYDKNLTLRFYVKDTGVGIPVNKIDKIFNAFTQAEDSTSRKYGGSGLGTTISKQLVTLMNGEIWVESPSGIPVKPQYPGSKFCFTIEAYSNEKLQKDLLFDDIGSLADINALLVLQNQQSRQRLSRLLEHEHIKYDIFECLDNNYCDLNRLLKTSNKYHLIFIFNGQNFDGFDLAKKLKTDGLSEQYALIMLSSLHKNLNYAESKKSGIDHYFPEPFDSPSLMNCILDFFPDISRPEKEFHENVRKDLSILVAEDNEINIRVAETIFSRLGLKADFAMNGKEAVAKVIEKAYDIIFMDIVMPEYDGVQATVEIRACGYQMPIIAMTATASSKTKNRAIASGMNDYIVKPIKMERIPHILSKWVV